VANLTRDWSRALVEINLAFDADVDRAVAALEGAMARAASDPEISADLVEPPEIFGWNQFSAWAVTVRLRAKVEPGTQWRVGRVLRRYALEALHNAGVAIASRPLV
jgi:moderate conductance mechanosensitive channel